METEMPDRPTDEEREGFSGSNRVRYVWINENRDKHRFGYLYDCDTGEIRMQGGEFDFIYGDNGFGRTVLDALNLHNACRGLPDPEAAIAGLVEAAEKAVKYQRYGDIEVLDAALDKFRVTGQRG